MYTTVYVFCTMKSRGRRKAIDDALFVYFSFSWLAYEVYKGKDELFFLSGVRDNGASITGHMELSWHDLDKELNN